MSLGMLKSDLFKSVVLLSDAYKMGVRARNEGYSEHFNPFNADNNYSEFAIAWSAGWHQAL